MDETQTLFDGLVTCQTKSCENFAIPISVKIPDLTITAICGACGFEITDKQLTK